MENLVPETKCYVKNCDENAKYRCPRCDIYYCSVTCYQGHSDTCVQAFSRQTDEQLRGQKVSEDERKRFSMLLKQSLNYNKEEIGLFAEHSDVPYHDCDHNAMSPQTSESDDEDEDAATLLTNLMDELSDEGKDALFSVLHKAMTEGSDRAGSRSGRVGVAADEGSEWTTDNTNTTAPTREKSGARKELAQKPNRSQRGKATRRVKAEQDDEDVADVLQDLLDDLEAGEVDYERAVSRLPATMAADFERRVRDGEVGDLVRVWEPWWGGGSDGRGGNVGTAGLMPELPREENLPVTHDRALRIGAHDSILSGVCNVLVAYCFVLRSMNGDWRGDVATSAHRLWATAATLASDRPPRGAERAAGCAAGAVDATARGCDAGAGARAVGDAGVILGAGGEWVSRALYDAAGILSAVVERKECKMRKVVKHSVRKLMFYTAWSLHGNDSAFRIAARELASMSLSFGTRQCETGVARKVALMLRDSQAD